MKMRSLAWTAAVSRSPSASVFASGFSHRTCLPAWIASMLIGACSQFGRQMLTASMSGRARML